MCRPANSESLSEPECAGGVPYPSDRDAIRISAVGSFRRFLRTRSPICPCVPGTDLTTDHRGNTMMKTEGIRALGLARVLVATAVCGAAAVGAAPAAAADEDPGGVSSCPKGSLA